MNHLPDDVAFVEAMKDVACARGLMRRPVFDEKSCQLVEADVRVDLLNVWHACRQRRHPRTAEIIDDWIQPRHLGHACHFGRIDVVRRAVETNSPLNGEDYGGNPIAAAIEAYVVTELHVQCVEALFAAGATATLDQFDSYSAESVGSDCDRAVLALLLNYAGHSGDPAVRAKAKTWSSA
jgi:hypothetical protein